ncbi:hypothetical protein [Euzebyella saccharophila]|uniref:DUF2383 domain-containing protein n=1 Tax=Euzebyella saccharophila TaxID=679664 RepID=A0ABV8JP52_9FLAO|nr:hypothetical protein [Euzebyella saccharophila]
MTQHIIFDRLESIYSELISAESIYATLIQADRFPHKRPYFKHRYFQYGTFAKNLHEEVVAVTGHKPLRNAVNEDTSIYKSIESSILEESLTVQEVDALVVKTEKKLISRYQQVLKYSELSNTTQAILESQVEELNNEWQKLRSNLQIELHKD